MSRAIQYAVLVAMVSLLGTYFYLNAYKVEITQRHYDNFHHGKAALEVELHHGDEILLTHHLRSSDLFDATAKHQLSFYQIGPALYQEIKEHAQEVRLLVNGKQTPYLLGEQGKALKLIWGDRKLVLVQQGDMRTIAANAWRDNVSRKGVVECYGEALCRSIRISGEGWGNLDGPYLDNEENIIKRGMPRGRWLYGPTSKIVIESRIATEIIMAINVLGLVEGMEMGFRGPLLELKPMPVKPYDSPYGGLPLHPQARLLKVALRPGANTIDLSFSRWHRPNSWEQRPLAAYMTALKVKAAQTPQTGRSSP